MVGDEREQEDQDQDQDQDLLFRARANLPPWKTMTTTPRALSLHEEGAQKRDTVPNQESLYSGASSGLR